MTTWIALMRAVNVGGRRAVAMTDAREVLADLGFSDVRSLLQSGNLVFRGNPRDAARLERTLERAIAARLALETDVFIRTMDEWRTIVARNPFSEEARSDPGRLVVMFLKEAAGGDAVKKLQGAIKGRETVRASGRQLYIVYPDGMGRSTLTSVLIERALGIRGTARNWNTTLKLASAVGL